MLSLHYTCIKYGTLSLSTLIQNSYYKNVVISNLSVNDTVGAHTFRLSSNYIDR